MSTQPAVPREAVAVITPGQHAVARAGQWSQGEARLIGSVLAPGLDADELRVYSLVCRHLDLDPWRREIYAWKDKGRITTHISISGWRKRCASTGLYLGQTEIEWCGDEPCPKCQGTGVFGADRDDCPRCSGSGLWWRDVWVSADPPRAARCGVRRRGSADPIYTTVHWREFERSQKRVAGRGPTNWDDRPAHMLGKVAEMHALQRAIPEAFDETRRELLERLPAATLADEDEVPSLPEAGPVRLVDAATGEIMESEPARPDLTPYAWEAALRQEMETVALPTAALEAVVGAPLTFAAIDAWLGAQEGRTPHTLVRAATDALAATEAKRR